MQLINIPKTSITEEAFIVDSYIKHAIFSVRNVPKIPIISIYSYNL
jgi:hypothetical protein